MTAFFLFISSFVVVFLLGFQSQIVRDKLRATAFFTSVGIGTCQLMMYKLAPSATTFESIVFILGGALGIVASIDFHMWWMKKFHTKEVKC